MGRFQKRFPRLYFYSTPYYTSYTLLCVNNTHPFFLTRIFCFFSFKYHKRIVINAITAADKFVAAQQRNAKYQTNKTRSMDALPYLGPSNQKRRCPYAEITRGRSTRRVRPSPRRHRRRTPPTRRCPRCGRLPPRDRRCRR